MKSIRTKLIVSFMGLVIVMFFVLAIIGVYYLVSAIELHSAKSTDLLIEENTIELNMYFSEVERSVTLLEDYLINIIDYEKFQAGEEYREEIYSQIEERAFATVNIMENVQDVYFRPEPYKYGSTSGFFLNETKDGTYKSITPTDILQYEEDDTEHVGWYYQAINNGEALWMEPYSNENINSYLISYVVPVYEGSDLLGVIGMDIEMTTIHQVINLIDYQNSEGMLVSQEGNLLYHKDYSKGLTKENFPEELQGASTYFSEEYCDTGESYSYRVGSKTYRLKISKLRNNMMLAITTPDSSLYALRKKMMAQLGLIFILVLICGLLAFMHVTRKIVAPIRELISISSRIARGELDQEISYQSDDEIGSLAESIRKISVEQKEYVDYMHKQSYIDVMTGVFNKAAYLAQEARLDRLIQEKMAQFTVFLFDINGLKKMNDTKGHEYGDMLIKDAAINIRAVFGGEQIYRIGGDEFVAIIKNCSREDVMRALARFDEHLRAFNAENDRYEEELAISKGVATYQPDTDMEFASVFARADEDMYRCKAKYYQEHHDRRRD
ncbi:sensor domain-containing diguanylate cyclase [Eubacterium oxidoreducens]|uniref:Diguanylate cyclase (GGDEF) domain-containing protein n=1 Tax=Eubacterium oxidoreducens TaxID=1732 RepID=A0A1G6A487_EUBOX|nr:diguanylate cyclase [Eubacterium oxidoreducens]SDB03258.1 diguanylate cyclase (GGDEF) domain-containing protein [Eubacterium oxidoreducens]